MKYIGGVVAGGSGSVGGCTFSRNRFGNYIRNRSIPVNPSSSQQQAVRNAFTTLSSLWRDLSVTERDNWINYALNTPYTDWEGKTIFLTGLQIYVACNTIRLQAGLVRQDVAPTIFGLAALTPPTLTSLVGATDLLTVAFTNTDEWAIAVGGALCVYISRPQSPATLFFKGPYRFKVAILGAVVPPTSPSTITPPFDYAAGQRAHVQFRAFNPDGRISGVIRQTILAT